MSFSFYSLKKKSCNLPSVFDLRPTFRNISCTFNKVKSFDSSVLSEENLKWYFIIFDVKDLAALVQTVLQLC